MRLHADPVKHNGNRGRGGLSVMHEPRCFFGHTLIPSGCPTTIRLFLIVLPYVKTFFIVWNKRVRNVFILRTTFLMFYCHLLGKRIFILTFPKKQIWCERPVQLRYIILDSLKFNWTISATPNARFKMASHFFLGGRGGIRRRQTLPRHTPVVRHRDAPGSYDAMTIITSGSAMAEGPRDALVSRNSATTKYRYRVALFAWSYV